MTKRSERRDGRFVRLNIAADELGVSVQTVKKYHLCGKLECERLPTGHWRVIRSSLDVLLKELDRPVPARRQVFRATVYFVKCHGFIKIGYSHNAAQRIQWARTFTPFPLDVLFLWQCETEEEAIFRERAAHDALVEYRHRGEWFLDCHAVRAYIESMKAADTHLLQSQQPPTVP